MFQHGGIMKNAIIYQNKSGKFFWWAHLASIDVLTRKNRNKPPPEFK